jgi:hypothetical protein
MDARQLTAWLNPLLVAAACAIMAYGSETQAAPVFYLSNETSGATPNQLHLAGVQPGISGTLHIWGSSDVPLATVSLDIVEFGDAISFTGVDVANPPGPPRRWASLDVPQVTDSSINDIGGGAIPGIAGEGVGAGTAAGANVLLASVNYKAIARGPSILSLRVGSNRILDYDAVSPMVRFGQMDAPLLNGAMIGAASAVGSIVVSGDALPVVADRDLGNRPQGSLIKHSFSTLLGDPPITWSNRKISGPSIPAISPVLTSDGMFSWNTVDSPLGLYNFDVTATNQVGSSSGRLSVNLVHEPASVFYISNEDAGADPGRLDLAVEPNSTGTLHIWVNSDLRLSGVNLDLVEIGGAIKFTGARIVDANSRWIIHDADVLAEGSTARLGADVLRYASGIGAGSPAGDNVLFASVDYVVTQGGSSSLYLKVGEHSIVDWDGITPNIRFGTRTGPLLSSYPPGAMGIVGSIDVIPEPATASLTAFALARLASVFRRRNRRPKIERDIVRIIRPLNPGSQPASSLEGPSHSRRKST